MSAWILIPCLIKLRSEFDLIAPGRDHSSDGSIGDTAHAAGGTSDHLPDEDFTALRGKDADNVNEVHAIDVDTDLRTPGLTMEDVVQFLLGRCRSGAEKRLRYIIYNRRIWEASNDWKQRAYTLTDPHTGHAHFSATYITSQEASTASWHLEDLVAISQADADLIVKTLRETVLPYPYDSVKPTREWGTQISYIPSLSGIVNGVDAKLKVRFDALAAGTPQDDVDEDAIAAAVLAGLTSERLALAITAAGLTPEAFAEALPDTFAEELLDKLAARLQRSQ